jgi:hypothetical protein
MFNTTNNQSGATTEASEKAIETAIRNGEAQAAQYDVFPSATGISTRFVVQHKVNYQTSTYTVETEKGYEKCNCPAWKKGGACKHEVMVAEYLQCEEADAKAAELLHY